MIAVVVPTVREEMLREFIRAWKPLFDKHKVKLVIVRDGKHPKANGKTAKQIMGSYKDTIFNYNDGVRNLGFAYVAKYLPDAEYILTLDDDVKPIGDPIADHVSTLRKRVPTSWISTADHFMRGFPYGIREESEVVLSHGIWLGVKDWDAPTQLVNGNPDTRFYKGPVPRGIYYPMCGMNVMFKRKLLPYMYWAPMGKKVKMDRFADIWAGIYSKREIDDRGWAVYTGGAPVIHERASNVWDNLEKEVKGLKLNETVWEEDPKHEYFKLYRRMRKRWEGFICGLL